MRDWLVPLASGAASFLATLIAVRWRLRGELANALSIESRKSREARAAEQERDVRQKCDLLWSAVGRVCLATRHLAATGPTAALDTLISAAEQACHDAKPLVPVSLVDDILDLLVTCRRAQAWSEKPGVGAARMGALDTRMSKLENSICAQVRELMAAKADDGEEAH